MQQKRTKRAWLLSIIIIVVAIGAYFYWQQDNAPSNNKTAQKGPAGAFGQMNRATPVYSASVSKGSLPIYVDALGSITPLQQVVVKSRIDGELLALHFNEGQTVNKGQLLAEIDDRSLQAQLQQQTAQLAKDKALLANAKQDLIRYTQLLKDDAIPAQQRDTQQSLVQQYQANIDSVQAQINNTKLQLSYTKIHAPLAGRIGFRQVDVGNQIKSGDANGLATIVEVDPISVVFSLPENQLSRLLQTDDNKKQSITLWNSDKTQQLATSEQWIIDNQIDRNTGSIRLKAIVNNTQQRFIANQFVNVRMQLDQLDDALLIPAHTILYGAQGDYVYRINEDEQVEMILVKNLQATGDWIAVASDQLKVGDRLVSDGSDRLRPGSRVTVIDPQATNKSSEPTTARQKPSEGRQGGERPEKPTRTRAE